MALQLLNDAWHRNAGPATRVLDVRNSLQNVPAADGGRHGGSLR
jgi:hypothetical protein